MELSQATGKSNFQDYKSIKKKDLMKMNIYTFIYNTSSASHRLSGQANLCTARRSLLNVDNHMEWQSYGPWHPNKTLLKSVF